jgi:hypothetical protein
MTGGALLRMTNNPYEGSELIAIPPRWDSLLIYFIS